MNNKYSNSIMASYATFKELYKSKKYSSPYQILSEFIKYIIVSKSLYTFTSIDIQRYLKEEFGFNPPIAVIRTALKGMKDVFLDNNEYRAINPGNNKEFRLYRQQSEEKSKIITEALLSYSKEKGVTNIDRGKLTQELIAFVLDEDGTPECQQLISEFLLLNENNDRIKDAVYNIREGSILYSGLAFNISEFGSLSKPITLFLDTEILFDIVGLNGSLFKTLADDLLNLIKIANRGGTVIVLKYFSKVYEEINQYFYRAERIVSGQGEINLSTAMKKIVEGCRDISDVSDKKVELFRMLSEAYGIRKDEKNDYYTEADLEYNLEGFDLQDYPYTEEINTEGYLFCSHINKLRKGEKAIDYLSSKYLYITDTRRVLEISKAIMKNNIAINDDNKYCDYCISLSHITNLLWYKLNRGFGSTDFPKNLDVIIKARTILSGFISQGISSTYKEVKNKAASGELSKEQAAAYIVALREKVTSPEDLNNENIEDLLDFSEEHFSHIEETIAQNKTMLVERDKAIEELSIEVSNLKSKLNCAASDNEEKQTKIEALENRIRNIEEQEKDKEKKRKRRKVWWSFIWSIFWRSFIAFLVVCLIWKVCKIVNIDFPTWLGVVLSGLGVLIAVKPSIHDKWKQFKEDIDI